MNGLRCVWRQAVQHKLRGLPSMETAVYMIRQYFIIVSKKQRERESTVSIIKSLNVKGRILCYLGHWTKQKRLSFCSSALLSFFFFSHPQIGFSVWECRFWFSFLFFFTCFSNARWKIPMRQVGVRVDHPFLWFWQLLAFVSAMKVILGVCFYLQASFNLFSF